MTDTSMLSAQCDELRKWADQLSERENEFGVVVRALVVSLREAADTIWELRCKCVGMVDMRERARLAETENDKLRKLVRLMWLACKSKGIIGGDYVYPYRNSNADERVLFEPLLRELGVEVD